jgi:hypothetical protein
MCGLARPSGDWLRSMGDLDHAWTCAHHSPLMMNAKELPSVEFADHTFVFN